MYIVCTHRLAYYHVYMYMYTSRVPRLYLYILLVNQNFHALIGLSASKHAGYKAPTLAA